MRSANLEKDVTAQLSVLKDCNRTLYEHPELLRTLPPNEMLFYFGKCWHGTWRDYVTNIMPFVCVSSWLAAGFQPHQFMLVRQEKLRSLPARELLPALANFTGLTYNDAVLNDKQEELRMHCESPDVSSSSPDPSSTLREAARARGKGKGKGHGADDANSNRRRANVERPFV